MKKDIKEILNYDIIEHAGIGDIRFGMSMEEFSQLYDVQKAIKNKILRIPMDLDKVTYYNAYYMFDDSVCLAFDIEKKLYSIYLYKNFKGKLNGKIGIGSYFGELRALRKDIVFCDDFDGYVLGTGWGRFKIMLDEDEYPTGEIDGKFIAPAWHWHRDFHLGKLDHYKIESISMEAWDRDNPDSSANWCQYLDEWIEPEEKYLTIRYI